MVSVEIYLIHFQLKQSFDFRKTMNPFLRSISLYHFDVQCDLGGTNNILLFSVSVIRSTLPCDNDNCCTKIKNPKFGLWCLKMDVYLTSNNNKIICVIVDSCTLPNAFILGKMIRNLEGKKWKDWRKKAALKSNTEVFKKCSY